MVNIEAGVAEATVELTTVRVMTLIRYAVVSVCTRLGAPFVGARKTLRQGSTSMNAVSPDHTNLNGGEAVAF